MRRPAASVLHIDTGAGLRGGQRQVLLLMRALRELGRESMLAAPEHSELADKAAAEGFALFPFRAAGDLDLPAAVRLKRFQAMAGAERPSLWHAHTARAQAVACLALRLCRGSIGPRLLVTRRTAFPSRCGPIHRAKYRDGHVAHYFAISSAAAERLAALGVARERISMVPSAVDADLFLVSAQVHLGAPATAPRQAGLELRARLRGELRVPADCFLVGAAGALDESKGYSTLIRSAAIVKERLPGLRLVIAGEGPARESLENEIARAGLGERFRLLGQRGNVPELFAAWDLFCMPSLAEGLGSVVLEAFAAGLPVVASDAGGLVDLVQPGETGLRFPAGDSGALAERLVEAASSPEKLNRMAATARRRVLADFSASRMAENVERVYAAHESTRRPTDPGAATGGLP